MRKLENKADYVLIACFGILVIIGLLALTSASAPVGYERFGDRFYFVKRQLLIGLLPGALAFFVAAKLSYRRLKQIALPAYIISLALLLMVFVPGIGTALNTGNRSWIILGSYSLQPAEFAKIAVILMLSLVLFKEQGLVQTRRGFIAALGLGFLPLGLIFLQPDIGTASILFIIIVGMMFAAGARFSHLSFLALAGVVAFGIMVAAAPYRAARFMTFLHPELDPQGIGYHINQAFMAIGSGGWTGLGLGRSRQKFEYLPEVQSDSIFAIIAEETGFIAVFLFIALLTAITYRSLVIAKQAPDAFGRLLSAGVAAWFSGQAFLNIAAMLGLLPLTGIPLPFVSHGGTALLVGLGAAGLLVNVSKNATV